MSGAIDGRDFELMADIRDRTLLECGVTGGDHLFSFSGGVARIA